MMLPIFYIKVHFIQSWRATQDTGLVNEISENYENKEINKDLPLI